MSDIGNILITLCGFCTVCCGAFTVALLMLFRVTGRSLILPAITTLSQMIFSQDDSLDSGLGAPIRSRSRPLASDLTAHLQSADQDFNQSLRQNLEGNFDMSSDEDFSPQSMASAQSYSLDPISPASDPPSHEGGSSGTFDDLINPDNLFGDAGLPGLRRFDDNDEEVDIQHRGLRASRRRRRGDDFSDDDIFGGMDDDGDGMPDFF